MTKYSGKYINCPTCDAEMPLTGDEKTGEEVYCPYCQTPLKLKRNKDTDEPYLEEDF
ncbi:MAG TPA: sulfonate ABC transporter [Deltaproteobacteria bacterium]|nr:sulfonate ABC transporter [Deltaproteobacteria bacterium]